MHFSLTFECLLFTALQWAARPRLASDSGIFAVAVKAGVLKGVGAGAVQFSVGEQGVWRDGEMEMNDEKRKHEITHSDHLKVKEGYSEERR